MTDPDWHELPETLRLALLDSARERLRDSSGRIPPVTPGRLAEAAGLSPVEFHRHCRVALLKLRARAADLDLDASDLPKS